MADLAEPPTSDNISESSTLLKTVYAGQRSPTRMLKRRKAKGFGARSITANPPQTRAFARKTGAR